MNPAFVSTPVAPLRPSQATRAVSARRAPVMSAHRRNGARLAALPALLAVAPALAEGTGEGLGIDNALLYLPLIVIPSAFFVLFLGFGRSQDNEDFTGEYDERRN